MVTWSSLFTISKAPLVADYNDFDISSSNNASITVDRVVGKFHSGEDIFRTIYDHLSNNIVQVNT